MDEQIELGRYYMSWDSVLNEEFSRQGDNVWSSNSEYWSGYDDESAEDTKKFVEERLTEYGITEFYVEIEEYE